MAPLLALGLAAIAWGGHGTDAGRLPVCSNRVIGAVVKRTGCTVGDARCWLRSGGFCADWIEKRLGADRPGALRLEPIRPEEVRPGDVAVFVARAHYAYVEAVVKDRWGATVAVELSEYNFGTCWVDRETMVTDLYKTVNRRPGVALADVDGGFLRARTAAR